MDSTAEPKPQRQQKAPRPRGGNTGDKSTDGLEEQQKNQTDSTPSQMHDTNVNSNSTQSPSASPPLLGVPQVLVRTNSGVDYIELTRYEIFFSYVLLLFYRGMNNSIHNEEPTIIFHSRDLG